MAAAGWAGRSLHWLLLGLAGSMLVAGLALTFLAPPFLARDELYHWQRGLQVSTGRLLAETLGPNSWGGPIDGGGHEFSVLMLRHYQTLQPVSRAETRAMVDRLAGERAGKLRAAFPSTASFSPLAYLPQAFGIGVARQLGGDLMAQMWAGRVANVLAYGVMVLLIWRLLPAGRRCFLLLAGLPAFVAIAASLSADPLNFTLPALFLAWCWRMRVTPEARFGWRQAAILLGFVLGLGLLKPIYLVFALFAVVLPGRLFSNGWWRLLVLGGSLAAGTAVALGWLMAYPFMPGAYWNSGADPAAQMAALRADPGQLVAVLSQTLRDWAFPLWVDSSMGFGGHPTPFSQFGPDWLSGVILACGLAMLLAEAGDREDLPFGGVALGLGLAYAALLLLAFWIGFTPPGAAAVQGLQGRYFMPFFLLMGFTALSIASPLRLPAMARDGLLAAGMAVNLAGLVVAALWMQRLWVP